MDLAVQALTGGNPQGGTPSVAAPGAPPGTGAPPPAGGTPSAAGGTPPAAGAFEWSNTLDAPVRELLTAKGFDKDPNALATSYYNANKVLSGAKDVVPLPADDAPPEAWAKFNEARGVPPNPDGYDEFKFKPDANPDPTYVKWARSFFHELGVPKGKAQAAIDKWQDFVAQRTTEFATNERQLNENALKELETKHGKEKWTGMVAKGSAAFKALGLSADVVSKIEANIGSAAVMELFATLGTKFAGESPVIGVGNSGVATDPTQMTLEQLNAAKLALDTDKDFQEAYLKADHPKHAESVARMHGLYEQIAARRRVGR